MERSGPRWRQESRQRPHHQNRAWQLGRELCLEIYRVTARFPQSELYGLTSQLRRAAVSIPSNIAEGSGRRTTRSYLSFLYRARGSLEEIDTQMELAESLQFFDGVDLTRVIEIYDETSRTLQGLINALEKKIDRR